MSKFILIYDCPFNKCDKLWLYDGLSKYGKVKVVDVFPKITYLKLVKKYNKLKIGKVLLRIVAFFQSIRAILISNKDDIIVVWNHFGGVFLSRILNILKLKRKVVSFCWIELPKRKNYKKIKKCLENEYFIPIINDKNLESQFIKLFDLKTWNGFMLPDVYDNNEKFIKPEYNKKEKYCFSGGLNNRDWETLLKVAEKNQKIDFIVVADKDDVKSLDIPKNVKLYTNIDKKEYYNFMKNSYITICPLKENRVSGLINILKSLQYGIPCITTNFDVTSSYFHEKYRNVILYNKNDELDLENKITYFWNLKSSDYLKISKDMQDYIKIEFNPNNNIKKLVNELKNRNWL